MSTFYALTRSMKSDQDINMSYYLLNIQALQNRIFLTLIGCIWSETAQVVTVIGAFGEVSPHPV